MTDLIPSLRNHITRAFSDEDLRHLCADHFSAVYEQFTIGMTKGQMIQLLLDSCVRQQQGTALLDVLERERPGLIGADRGALLAHLTETRLGGAVEEVSVLVSGALAPDLGILASVDTAREGVLQSYLDRMSVLLLEQGLRHAHVQSEVWGIARTLTANVMPRLDKHRQVTVIRFLCDEELIRASRYIVDLRGLDLSEADLGGLNLVEVDLSMANLRGAELFGSDLTRANLREADMSDAKLGGAILRDAYLYKAKLIKANLLGTQLIGARLGMADLRGAVLIATDLQHAELIGATFIDTQLHGANLTGAHFGGVDFTGSNITREQLATAKSIELAVLPSDLV